MTAPVRIQRKRTAGWKMPPNTVCVTRPGKWGNPYLVRRVHSPAGWWGVFLQYPSVLERVNSSASKYGAELDAVARYLRDLVRGTFGVSIDDVRRELSGKNLACYCPIGSTCHGDMLLKIANSREP